jgi:5-methylcytosine-specific restriction enzyme A
MSSDNLVERQRPDLPRPRCTVKLVCGPPAAGKSTYVAANAAPGDIVIDLDDIAREHGYGRDRPASAVAGLLYERNRRLAALADAPSGVVAWVILTAPSRSLRTWWRQKLGVKSGDMVLLLPSRDELIRRIKADPGRKSVAALHMELVDQWLARERGDDPGILSGDCDDDGFPTDPLHPWNKQPSSRPHEAWKKFYGTAAWQKRRALQLRHFPLCAYCLARSVVTVATVVDHVEPHKGDWNKFRLGALQSLCKLCHDSSKRHVELAGYGIDVDDDGWPVDPKHPANKGASK